MAERAWRPPRPKTTPRPRPDPTPSCLNSVPEIQPDRTEPHRPEATIGRSFPQRPSRMRPERPAPQMAAVSDTLPRLTICFTLRRLNGISQCNLHTPELLIFVCEVGLDCGGPPPDALLKRERIRPFRAIDFLRRTGAERLNLRCIYSVLYCPTVHLTNFDSTHDSSHP